MIKTLRLVCHMAEFFESLVGLLRIGQNHTVSHAMCAARRCVEDVSLTRAASWSSSVTFVPTTCRKMSKNMTDPCSVLLLGFNLKCYGCMSGRARQKC